MKKLVNGVEVELSPQEEAAFLAEWALNPVPSPQVILTPLQFIDRFTEAEQLAITTAAMGNAAVNLWLMKCMGATSIDPSDPRTVAGMNALVAAGLITPQRRDEILNVS
jgi:hypothetical protein